MSTKPLKAKLVEDYALVTDDQGITLYNKGYYGQPNNKGVKLNGFETLHLSELERIDTYHHEKLYSEQEIIDYFSDKTDNFSLRYLVYKDLRNRGYVVNQGKGSSFFFRLYARGDVPKKDSAKYYVTPLQEGGSIKLSTLEDLERLSQKSQKILVFGMVDALGDVSYLRVTKMQPNDLSKEKQFSNLDNWNWDKGWNQFQQFVDDG